MDVIWECKELWYQISRYKHIVYCIYHVNELYKLFAIVYFLGKKCEIKQQKKVPPPCQLRKTCQQQKNTLHLYINIYIYPSLRPVFSKKKKASGLRIESFPPPKKKKDPSHSRLSELDDAAAVVFAGWGAGKAASEGGISWWMAMGGNHNGPGKPIKIHPVLLKGKKSKKKYISATINGLNLQFFLIHFLVVSKMWILQGVTTCCKSLKWAHPLVSRSRISREKVTCWSLLGQKKIRKNSSSET